MRRAIPIILDTCAAVAFALWLGGLCVSWAALAPLVRADSAAHPAFVETVRRFGAMVEACGIALAAIQWALRRRYERERSLFIVDGIRMLVVFGALLLAEYGRYVLIPGLVGTKAPGALGTLQALAVLQGVLLVGYAGITSWLQAAAPIPAVRTGAEPAAQPQSATAAKSVRVGRKGR